MLNNFLVQGEIPSSCSDGECLSPPSHRLISIHSIAKYLFAALLLFTTNTYSDNNQPEVMQLTKSAGWATGNPYVSVVGQFRRSDGVMVTAANEKTTAFADIPTGARCVFVLPDGTAISVGKVLRVCLVHIRGSGAELYRYESTSFGAFLPFASRVQNFDGFKFVDVTTPWKRILSSVIHVRAYLFEYSVTIFYFALLALLRITGKRIVTPNPKQRWLAVVRSIGKTIYALLIIICVGLLLTEVIGLSRGTLLSVYLAIFGIGFVLYRWVDKLAERKWDTQKN